MDATVLGVTLDPSVWCPPVGRSLVGTIPFTFWDVGRKQRKGGEVGGAGPRVGEEG